MSISCTQILLSNAEFLNLMGWCLAAALVIGGLIDENPKKLRNWVFAAITFAVIEEILRAIYLNEIHNGSGFSANFLCVSSAISFSVATVYVAGLIGGWFIVFYARKYGRKSYNKQASKTSEEKENAL